MLADRMDANACSNIVKAASLMDRCSADGAEVIGDRDGAAAGRVVETAAATEGETEAHTGTAMKDNS